MMIYFLIVKNICCFKKKNRLPGGESRLVLGLKSIVWGTIGVFGGDYTYSENKEILFFSLRISYYYEKLGGVMFLQVSEFLQKLEEDIEGSDSRKSGESKKKFAKMFGVSPDWVYRHSKATDTPQAFIFCDYKKGQSYLLKVSQTADFTV